MIITIILLIAYASCFLSSFYLICVTGSLRDFTRQNEEKKKKEAEDAAKIKATKWDEINYGADFKGRGESLWQNDKVDDEAVGMTEIK